MSDGLDYQQKVDALEEALELAHGKGFQEGRRQGRLDWIEDTREAKADAWDEGYKWGQFDHTILQRTGREVTTDNPYRDDERPGRVS